MTRARVRAAERSGTTMARRTAMIAIAMRTSTSVNPRARPLNMSAAYVAGRTAATARRGLRVRLPRDRVGEVGLLHRHHNLQDVLQHPRGRSHRVDLADHTFGVE